MGQINLRIPFYGIFNIMWGEGYWKCKAAQYTLEQLKYKWNGGIMWRPPVGVVPDYIVDDNKYQSYRKAIDKISYCIYTKDIHEVAILTFDEAKVLNERLNYNKVTQNAT